MRSGLTALGAVCKMGGPVWFINLDPAAGIIVRSHAKFCGEFSATSVWINGLISNYNGVYNTFIKFKKIAFSAFTAKNKNAFSLFKPWYFTRSTWPRATFISSVHNSYSPTKESLQLNIPCLGIVDTNVYTHVVSVPIPGNDESIDCLVFYNDFVAQYVLSQKYLNITSWFFSVRRGHRFLSFKNWIIKKGKSKKKVKNNSISLVKFSFNFVKHFSLGMRAFFSQNQKYSRAYEEHIKVFEENDVFKHSGRKKASTLFLLLLKSREYFVKVTNISGQQKSWFVDRFIYTRYLKGPYFKKSILNKAFVENKLVVDRFYKTHLHWSNLKKIFILKLLKFFLFFNFTHYMHLTNRHTYPNNVASFLGIVYFRAIAGFFLNPSHPFPVELGSKKGYVKHFNAKFNQINPKFVNKAAKFKKGLNYRLSPRIRRKRKTFRQNGVVFNKQFRLLFKRFLSRTAPRYYKFLALNLPKGLAERNKPLIMSYYKEMQKEKLSYISPKFISNPYKVSALRKDFFFKIRSRLNKSQARLSDKFLKVGFTIGEQFKKYTHYKHNRYFPSVFSEHAIFAKAYENFVWCLRFFVFKKQKSLLPGGILAKLGEFFQKAYFRFKLNYLRRNWYLTNIEKFNAAKLDYYNKAKAAYSYSRSLNSLKRRKNASSKSSSLRCKGVKPLAKKLLAKRNLSLAESASSRKLMVSTYEANYKAPLKFNLINHKNKERLTKFNFFKLFKRLKKKPFRANLAHRLNLLANLTSKRSNKIFYLRKPAFLKQAFVNFKNVLGWLVLGSKFKLKLRWKGQKDVVFFPRWHFLNFPTATVGSVDVHTRPFKRLTFFNYKNISKLDSSLSKFFNLYYYYPYVLKFSCVGRFFSDYGLKHRRRGFKARLRDVFANNNLSIHYKNSLKFYACIWV
jgi:ribosomal protein S2